MPNEFLRAEWFCEGRGYCHPLCGRHELLRLITRQIWAGKNSLTGERMSPSLRPAKVSTSHWLRFSGPLHNALDRFKRHAGLEFGVVSSAFAFQVVCVWYGLKSAPTHHNHSLTSGPIFGVQLRWKTEIRACAFQSKVIQRDTLTTHVTWTRR
jgi:hypothetical protein